MQLLRYNLLAMSNFDHPNILRIASWAIESQITFILTEYLPYGDYIERAFFSKSVSEKTVANVVKQILSAI
jgi:serine/threonine protein kinase